MIGQKNLQNRIEELIESNKFPRFVILVGQEGSGRKTISKFIARKLGAQCAISGVTVDEVREVISEANKVSMPIVYVLADADRMSPAAKNAILKVTEEPPQTAYFILTLTDLNNTLATIRSRGSVFYMDPYSAQDIGEYYWNGSIVSKTPNDFEIIQAVCETPGEVDKLAEIGTQEFYDYVVKVVDNIAEVSGSNSFKIAGKIKFKETDEDKYDLRLFWKIFMAVCVDRLRDDPYKYAMGINTTTKYLQDLRINGINKQSAFDMWLLDIRKEWM